MVVVPYVGTMGKFNFQFSLSGSTQFDFYQQVENTLKANDI